MDLSEFSRRIWTFFWYESDPIFLDVKFKVFKEDDKKDSQLVPSLTKRAADFNYYMRMRNKLNIGAEKVGKEENLSLVLIPTMSKDVDEQLKLAHKFVDMVDRANRKNCVTLLRYNVDKPRSSSAQV